MAIKPSGFGDAPVKGKGQQVWFDETMKTNFKSTGIQTTYVERRVPIHLKDEAHTLIDNWLISMGYDPKEI